MEETNLQTENKEVQTVNNDVQTGDTENQVEEKEMPVCKSAVALRNLGIWVLCLGILFGIILFGCTVTIEIGSGWSRERVFNPASLVYLVTCVFSSVIFWAFARAVADIAESTFKMAHK